MTGAQRVPTNLPAPLTSFIGRDREIADVRRLLTRSRLVTLTGAGGCGKSRLAFETAARAAAAFPDGVWAIEFSSLVDPALVPNAIASALDLPEQPGRRMMDVLLNDCRAKRQLLVLDNCEHLLSACTAAAGALLEAAPAMRILATSRAPLGVPGEATWRVPSLSMPQPADSVTRGAAARSDAVRLFVERAVLVQPAFRLTDASAPAVADICRRLDGMPLAIELAAARVRALSVQQIAARLGDRLRLLTGGAGTVARHRTLRAAMDWSYDLLTDRERTLLARLAVFRGGWTLHGAEAVCAGDGIEASDLLDGLTSLVDKSLVIAEIHEPEVRYRLLETTWQYAHERLVDSDDVDAVERRHRDWYLEFALQAERYLRGEPDGGWLERVALEHDNLRAALAWTGTQRDGGETELRLATALRWFWIVRGYWSEGRAWLEGAISRAGRGSSVPLARALECVAYLARCQGDDDKARTFSERCLAVSTAAGDRYGIADALHRLAYDALDREAYGRADHLCRQSLALYQELNAAHDVALALSTIGSVARHQRDGARARTAYREALDIATRTGDRIRAAYVLCALAALDWDENQSEQAEALYTKALGLSRDLGYRMIAVAALEGLAGIACARGHGQRGARLLGTAAAQRGRLGLRLLPADRAAHERRVAAVRAACGEKTFEVETAAGGAMTIEAATEYALAGGTAAPAGRRSAGRGTPALTGREREVAALIAQGLSNREIASHLIVAERTAEGHVQSILTKLCFQSRAQIAVWAVHQGLEEKHVLLPVTRRPPPP